MSTPYMFAVMHICSQRFARSKKRLILFKICYSSVQ
ncbi:hypothetical protein AB6A40_010799 [Gnathostoma spinigerum]|uniref:Uncharacterized protein n=1 Tax=Gnathostoma spinigerum TaxID=75299 RepID=A0ABD6F3X6_9BILA